MLGGAEYHGEIKKLKYNQNERGQVGSISGLLIDRSWKNSGVVKEGVVTSGIKSRTRSKACKLQKISPQKMKRKKEKGKLIVRQLLRAGPKEGHEQRRGS